MTVWASTLFLAVRDRLAASADAEDAAAMSAYLRDQFVFFGVRSRQRKQIVRVAMAGLAKPTTRDIDAFARRCYEEPQRELHTCAVGVVRSHQHLLDQKAVPLLRHLVVTHSWWDTVDELAAHVAGGIVRRNPDAVRVMDEWVGSEHMWLARTAILHQLRFKEATDVDRLFRYCLLRASEPDFFYRKAIGWALRQYARTDPERVRSFCELHSADLSPLSLREATKHLTGSSHHSP